MAAQEQVAKLNEGVASWNAWRSEHPDSKVDLTEANLAGWDLTGADLRKSNLRGATLDKALLNGAQLNEADLGRAWIAWAELEGVDLGRASLKGAILTGAKLRAANLEGADLARANLEQANLRGASLVRVGLYSADLSGAELAGADLAQASVGYTIFANTDLSTVKGLDAVQHYYPSTIGIDTVFRSEGNIPESFLRGAGVPEGFIAYMKSIVGTQAIEYYSCFISYSTKDQEFADRLHADLQSKGVRCWFAPHDIRGGKKVHEQIDDAIRLHDRLLLILSKHSMESEWVRTEIAKARNREVRDKRRVLFPIRLVPFDTLRDWEYFDSDTGKDSAREIREYFVPDFSDWKNHDSFQGAFQHLLRDLKASDSGDSDENT